MVAWAERKDLRTWVEIDTKALDHNLKIFKDLAGDRKLMAVVKSNAYGHGLVETALLLETFGSDWLAVDSIKEASALRKRGIKIPILVLGYTIPENFVEARGGDISLTISSFEVLETIESLLQTDGEEKIKVHIKVDTGMHRQGFLPSDIDRLLNNLRNSKIVKVEGLYSHLADPGNSKVRDLTDKQLKIFNEIKEKFFKAGFSPLTHIMATAGNLAYSDFPADIIRAGLGLYGLWPTEELKSSLVEKIDLRPVLSWKTIVSEIKSISVGEYIGYGFTEKLERDSLVAVCPVGYWHGYLRSLSSLGQVAIKGKLARVLGRVSMDMMVLDITDVPEVKVGDEVILVGQRPTATEVAERAGTISYEIITRINPLSRRFYL